MKSIVLFCLFSLFSIVVLANDATFDPSTGAVDIPRLTVMGDPAGQAFDIKMQQVGTLDFFKVTDIKSSTTPLNVQLGTRPYFLVEDMDAGALKTKLQSCGNMTFSKTEFSIGHRGAALQYPEHTKESYVAAARMGAGILECDVTFTKDRQLVCRHSQCDLHTTTNILATPLATKCSVPFNAAKPEDTKCCTSDITLAEFKTLCGKMDASNPKATTVAEFMKGTANWRTDLFAGCGTVLSHKESIELFKQLGTKMTPELKSPSVTMPFEGDYTQEAYAQQMIDEYKAANVLASDVFAQSFNYSDVLYWVKKESEFGKQAVYLDGRYGETVEDQTQFPKFNPNQPETWEPLGMQQIVADGVKYVAPPMWVLVTLDANNNIVPSAYAVQAKAAGLNMITWTLERSGFLNTGGGWYYTGVEKAINNDGDMLIMLDVLARQVGIKGIFSDWAATVTYYANCMGFK